MLASISKTLETILEWTLIVIMVALTVVVIVAVIFRKLDASLSWYDEVASIMLSWVTYYGGALAALKRRHIGFDSVLLAIPMPARMWATAIAELLVLGSCSANFSACPATGARSRPAIRSNTWRSRPKSKRR